MIGLFLGWSCSASPGRATRPPRSRVYRRYALNAVLFLIVFTAIRDHGQRQCSSRAFVAGAVVAAAYGIASPARFE